MNGILIVDKPAGLTSADVVREVKRKARVKVGHLGTLDPFATGVLPLCLGEATKIAQFLNEADKDYAGLIQLGTATDTADCTGSPIRVEPVPEVTEAALRQIEARFIGDYDQVPPMYSAIKRDGVPLYKLARKGVEVERESRRVRITSLSLAVADSNALRFTVSCSKGTYVRVLAEDIGLALHSVAHLRSLRRTRFGSFDLARAVELEEWNPGRDRLISIREVLSHLPVIAVDDRDVLAVRKGQPWVLTRLVGAVDSDLAVLVDSNDCVVAVAVRERGRWTFGRVLQPEQVALQG